MDGSDLNPRSLRDVHRAATRDRLIDAAVQLFDQRGYEATTVEDIAAYAQVSPRTFFRYFGTKDAVILGKFDATGDRLANALLNRPADEPVWESLRRAFDYFVAYTEDENRMRQSEAIDAIISTSDTLRAGYLTRMARMQELATEALRERSELSALQARALVAAAFACLTVAGDAVARGESTFGEALDLAMDTLRPRPSSR